MLYASFDIWYSCLRILRDDIKRKNEEFDRFCEECDKYHSLWKDDKNVHQNGDAVFTREHYETLSGYLHVAVTGYNRQLRRDCPEWGFVLSEFHNFVIEHEMQRLLTKREIESKVHNLKEMEELRPQADIRGLLDALKETRMISGTGAFGDGGRVDGDQAGGATTRRVVRPSLHGDYGATGGVRFANPDISYVDCAIEVNVKKRGFHDELITTKVPEEVDVDGVPVRTYRLDIDQVYDVYVENRSGRDIVMQHAYIGEDRCEERREIFNSRGGECHDVFFTLGAGESKNVQSIHKERGEPMDGVDIRTVVGRTVVKLRFVV
jgi:hypothetical protein